MRAITTVMSEIFLNDDELRILSQATEIVAEIRDMLEETSFLDAEYAHYDETDLAVVCDCLDNLRTKLAIYSKKKS